MLCTEHVGRGDVSRGKIDSNLVAYPRAMSSSRVLIKQVALEEVALEDNVEEASFGGCGEV